MAQTLKFGNGTWATKKGSTLAYNDQNNRYKPLPFTTTRASSATRVNKAGLIETVGSGEPRIDFKDNTKGALLLEPSRSNLFTYSEDFTTWSRSGWTLTSGLLSPNGGLDAYSVLRTTGSTFARTVTLLSNTTYTFSAYIKNVNATNIQLRVQNQAGNTSGTESNCIVFSVTDQTNDSNFTRITHTFNTGDAGSYGLFLGYYSAGEYIVFGAQLEQGSYATSYIPTSGSVVTRVAEQGINGGAGITIFSNTSAVWFIDLERNGVDTDSSGSAIALRNSSFSQQIRLHFDQPATNIRFRDGVNGYATISTITGANPNVRKKLALRIDGSTLSTFSNGIKIGSDYTAPNAFDLEEIDFSSIGFKIHDMRFYNTTLTDQELIALTTI